MGLPTVFFGKRPFSPDSRILKVIILTYWFKAAHFPFGSYLFLSLYLGKNHVRQVGTHHSKGGYIIKFIALHFPNPSFLSLFRDLSQEAVLLQKLCRLIELGVIEEVSYQHAGKGFYSRYFVVPKKSGGLCPFLDRRKLKHFIKKIKFRMIILTSIFPSLMSLKDAYFHMVINPTHRKYPHS